MPFTFKNYGTFTGPNSINGDYDYDAVSEEGFWYKDLPTDTSFKLTDLAVVFFRNPSDYLGFYLYGVNTSLVTLAKNTGNIPVFVGNIGNSIFNGNVFVNGQTVVNGSIFANGIVNLAGVGNAAAAIIEAKALPAKPFDIPHPSKEGHRLRHVSLEGPEISVFYRGKGNTLTINLPEYWKDLVHEESISVNITPIGSDQNIWIQEISNNQIILNSTNSEVNYFYTVYAERKDMEKLIVEYEGKTIKDYPGQDWLKVKGV
jgi:hypothetical protein